MGFRGILSPRETGGAWAVPEPRDAEEQLHPVPAEGGCLPQSVDTRSLPKGGLLPGSSLLPLVLFVSTSGKILSFGWCSVGEMQLFCVEKIW